MAAINRIVEGSLFHQLDAQFISSKESPRKCKIVVESGYYQSANEWLQGNRPLARNVNLRDIPFYVKSVVMLRKTENRSFNHLHWGYELFYGT